MSKKLSKFNRTAEHIAQLRSDYENSPKLTMEEWRNLKKPALQTSENERIRRKRAKKAANRKELPAGVRRTKQADPAKAKFLDQFQSQRTPSAGAPAPATQNGSPRQTQGPSGQRRARSIEPGATPGGAHA